MPAQPTMRTPSGRAATTQQQAWPKGGATDGDRRSDDRWEDIGRIECHPPAPDGVQRPSTGAADLHIVYSRRFGRLRAIIRDEEFTGLLTRRAVIVYAGHSPTAGPQWTWLGRGGRARHPLGWHPVACGLFVPPSYHERPSDSPKGYVPYATADGLDGSFSAESSSLARARGSSARRGDRTPTGSAVAGPATAPRLARCSPASRRHRDSHDRSADSSNSPGSSSRSPGSALLR
jgi:hypothetical protein